MLIMARLPYSSESLATHERRIMILRLPKSDLRMRGGNAGRLSTEISAPVAGRISTSLILN